jgi:hypothetical protein
MLKFREIQNLLDVMTQYEFWEISVVGGRDPEKPIAYAL